MASSFTTNKNIEKPGYNDYAANPTGWSGPINADWDIIDRGFGGVQSKSTTGGTTNLTITETQNLVLTISGTLASNAIFTLPLNAASTGIVAGQWIVRNSTTGAFTVTISPVSGGGTSVVVAQGGTETVYSDGTNVSLSKTAQPAFPVGGIVMWSGSIATIPTGWFLCNGANSTPDLRDRFIIGASQDDAGVAKTNVTGSLTQTGGSKDAIVVSHTHTATVTDPGHAHTYIQPADIFGVATGGTSAPRGPNFPGASTGGNTTGITVANSTTGSSGTNANLVPYYALAYIMRGAY
jgi:hypothetical protein